MRKEAEIITRFLMERKIRARITGGFLAPAFAVYALDVAQAQRFAALEEALDDLQRVIYSARVRAGEIDAHDAQQRVVVRASAQPPVLEVSRSKPARLEFGDLPIAKLGPNEALAGVAFLTPRGQPIVWRLDDPSTPHALVAGTSGSGKSNLLLSLLLSLAANTDPQRLALFVVDGGNSSLLAVGGLKHTARFAGDAQGAAEVVNQVAALVQERKRRSLTEVEVRVLLVVDELANIMAVLPKVQAVQMEQDLAVVAAEGRKFGVHLLAATQKPLAEVTGSLTKSNLALRLVGAVLSKNDAALAAAVPGTGAERLAGRGDFIVRAGMTVRRFQAPLVGTPFGAVMKINRAWRGSPAAALPVEPVRTGEPAAQGEEMSVRGGAAPVRTGSPVQPAGRAAAVVLPLPRNRPPTAAEAAELRQLYKQMGSKNQVLQAAYGTKNALLLSYVTEALAAS